MKQKSFTSLINKPYRPFAAFKGDTLQYLQYNFVERKDQYQGKKLEVLLNDLEFNIKYLYQGGFANDQTKGQDMTISFYDAETHDDRSLRGYKLYVLGFLFDAPFSITELDKIDKKYGYNWTKHHYDFFKNQVVKDTWVIARPQPK
jgi:hypothetical protein